MNAAHLHLLINHVPVFLTLVSIALLAWGAYNKNSEYYKLAFIGFLIAGIAIVVVFESGENAEDLVENIPGVTHDSIEEHEEAAEVTRWLTLILAAGGIAGLYMNSKKVKGFNTFVWLMLLFSLLTAGYLAYTANLGGRIRHSEINDTATGAVTTEDRSLVEDLT